MKTVPSCLECGKPVSWGIHLFSRRIYGHTLCVKDQCKLEESGATALTVDLYLALKSRGFPVWLEYFDNYKHVDIAMPEKLYIEINGPYNHTRNHNMNDLSRVVQSLEKNIPTIIVSNSMLENHESFEHAVNEISKACTIMMRTPEPPAIWQLISPAQLQ
jgi:hypothetical protein